MLIGFMVCRHHIYFSRDRNRFWDTGCADIPSDNLALVLATTFRLHQNDDIGRDSRDMIRSQSL